jgi:RimJ/RimL family protein N-acetyltransferase
MVGDVNLYWNDHDDPNTAEIEIMVAEQKSRRKGIAKGALTLLMTYGLSRLKVTTFRAKIGEDNIPSQNLFKSLGYEQVSRSEVFKEVTYELRSSGGGAKAVWDTLSELSQSLRMGEYDPGVN